MSLFPIPFRYAKPGGPSEGPFNPAAAEHDPSIDLIGGDFAEYDLSAGTAGAYRSPKAAHSQIPIAELVGWWIVSVTGTGLGAREHRIIRPEEIPVPMTDIVVGTTVGAVANGMPLTFGATTVYLGRGATRLLLAGPQALGDEAKIYARRLI